MANIKYRISLEGGEQVSKELLTVEQSIQRLQDAAKSGTGADTFASTTASISSLGKTADEAFSTAAAAAKKFGASTSELAGVEGVIKALAARSRDSSIAFATLAQNYDKARASVSGSGQAAAQAGAGLQSAGAAAVTAAAGVSTLNKATSETRRQLALMAQVASVSGIGPLGRLASAVGGAAASFGGLAGSVAGLAVAGGALFKFATNAAESAKALQTLSQVSGQSFNSLSALQSAFGQIGVSAETFTKTFTNLFQQLRAQAPQLATNFALAADKAASAVDGLRQAELNYEALATKQDLAKGYISAATAASRLLAIEKERAQLALDAAERNVTEKEIENQNAQANNVRKLVAVLEQARRAGAEIEFPGLTTVESMAAAISTRLLQVQRAGGGVVEELANILRSMKAVDAFNVGAKLGIPAEVIQSIRASTQSVGQLATQLQKLGVPLSQDDLAPLLAMDAEIKKVTAAWTEFTTTLGVATAPFFIDLIGSLTEFGLKAVTLFDEVGTAWNFLAEKFRQNIAPKLSGIGEWAHNSVEGLNDLVAKSVTGYLQLAGVAEETIKKITDDIRGLAPEAQQAGATAGQELATGLQQGTTAADRLLQKLAAIRNAAATPVTPMPDPFVAASAGADVLIQKLGAVKAAFQLVGQEADIWRRAAAGQGGEAQIWNRPGMARGGLFGGRGTGTSDSNLAWLSRGEHIMPARAVRQPGVLAFLEALRRSGGNLRGILDDMGHFARGGLVIPAFAAGGLNSGGSNVTIQFPGLPPVTGLRASSQAVDELHKAAALAQVRSGGRKPSRYS